MSLLPKIQAQSNETRFKIVELVREREMAAATTIARRFKVTRPPSQHIAILSEAGFSTSAGWGAQRFHVVGSEGFDELVEYIEGFRRPRLRRLKHAAEAVERSKRTK